MKIEIEESEIKELEKMYSLLKEYLSERNIPFLNPIINNFSCLVNFTYPFCFKEVFIDLVNPIQRRVSVEVVKFSAGDTSYFWQALGFKLGIGHCGRYQDISIQDDEFATKERIFECLDWLFAKASTWEEQSQKEELIAKAFEEGQKETIQ